jgi:plasmid stability protein
MMTFEIEIPDELYKLLQKRAEREHRTVAEEVVHLLETALQDELQGGGTRPPRKSQD